METFPVPKGTFFFLRKERVIVLFSLVLSLPYFIQKCQHCVTQGTWMSCCIKHVFLLENYLWVQPEHPLLTPDIWEGRLLRFGGVFLK